MPITNHISLSISLLYCSSEEYCDCSIRVFRSDCSIRVYRSFKQVFRGPFMGPPGAPFMLGPGAKCPSCPPPPPPPPVGGPADNQVHDAPLSQLHNTEYVHIRIRILKVENFAGNLYNTRLNLRTFSMVIVYLN